ETPITAKQVYEVYGSWSQHVTSWTRKPHPAIYVMRYEDMLAEPQKTFGALAPHLLFTPSESELADAIDRSSFERLREQEEKAGFKERPEKAERFFREGRAEQWKGRAHAGAGPAHRRRARRADAALWLSAALVLATAVGRAPKVSSSVAALSRRFHARRSVQISAAHFERQTFRHLRRLNRRRASAALRSRLRARQ